MKRRGKRKPMDKEPILYNEYREMKSLAIQLKERYKVFIDQSSDIKQEPFKDIFTIPIREERNSVIRILTEMNDLEDKMGRRKKLENADG